MIKLFRNLKMNLIKEGKLSKYLFYALGEILLVVIGIIIAVQVNNLIDADKRHTQEIQTLNEIKLNLEGDLYEIDEENTNYILMMLYDSTLIASMQNWLPFTDSLAAYAYTIEDNAHFNPTISGYNMLVSKGIDLITDDSLRIQLTDLYERWYLYYQKYEQERIFMVQTVFKPYMVKNFYLEDYPHFWTKQKRTPMNYGSLLKDPEWISILQTNRGLASVMSRKSRDLTEKIQAVHNHINEYLVQQSKK